MSGYSERAVTQQGAMPPGTGFVEKPFTVEQLASADAGDPGRLASSAQQSDGVSSQ